jgi:hypothetical protein
MTTEDLKQVLECQHECGPLVAKIGQVLTRLAELGYQPGIYKRGNLWRAHVSVTGNTWHDSPTAWGALVGAIRAQIKLERGRS